MNSIHFMNLQIPLILSILTLVIVAVQLIILSESLDSLKEELSVLKLMVQDIDVDIHQLLYP